MLRDRIGKELLIFDGAMGTQLQKAGLGAGDIPEELNIEQPELLKKIHKSYLEAAKDLGATGARAFLKVTLPLSKAGIISGISMVFLPSMTNYVVSNWLTYSNVTIIGTFIENAFKNSLWNNGSVTALILLLLMFVITWLTGGFNTEAESGARGTSLW